MCMSAKFEDNYSPQQFRILHPNLQDMAPTVVGRKNRLFIQEADGAGNMKGGENAKRRLS